MAHPKDKERYINSGQKANEYKAANFGELDLFLAEKHYRQEDYGRENKSEKSEADGGEGAETNLRDCTNAAANGS